MFKQFITVALRNIFKDKVLSSINFINLVAGFVTFILISLFVYSELTWDKHNNNYERIYRVQLFMDQAENVIQHTWSVTAALSRHELTTIPEIEKIALIHDVGDNNKDGVFLSLDKKNQFKVRWGYFSDPSVFDIFTFRFVEGDPAKALQEPYSLVLSQTVANKLFPGTNALGKHVYGENKVSFKVTGVYEDLPKNSEWRPYYILPMNTFAQIQNWKDYESNYWAYSFNTYVLLKPNTDPKSVDTKIYNALAKYRKEHHPYLRPLNQLHINPYFKNEIFVVIGLISFIAILILILSSVNYINLQTARSTTRLKEIGIKKTVGFSKRTLYGQFIFESVLISFIACLLALIVAQMVLPLFKYLIGSTGIIGIAIASNVFSIPGIVFLVLAVSLISGFISGLYPAYIIASFNPIKALKEKVTNNDKNGFGLKKVLVTVQFTISLFLLINSFIVYRQTQHMMKGNFGFNHQNIVYANIVSAKSGSFEPLRQNLLQHPEIKDASFSDYIPFIIPGGDDLTWEGSNTDEKVFFRDYHVSYSFFSTYNIPIIKGRNFSPDFPDDKKKCIINETAARVMGWEDPIGKFIIENNKKVEVIGVIRDYIAQSMHNPIEPHWYHVLPDTVKLEGIFTVALNSNTKDGLKIVKQEFSGFFPEDAFEFIHLETTIQDEAAAQAWVVIRNINIFFALLSIIISSVGLFGLVMFFARKKMKEISIRKVLGFSIHNLYLSLSKEFLWLLLIANLFAWPASYFIYTTLPGAHKYGIEIWEFLLAAIIIFAVAIVTISYHIVILIKQNPVEALKYE
jgi:putative ABC transport system permease protein